MSATVDINTHTEPDAITIPIQAVTTREKEKADSTATKNEGTSSVSADNNIDEVVFVYEADTARMVKVGTGIQDNEYIQILSGLQTGQEVITGPYSTVSRKLKNGLALVRKEKNDEKENAKDKKDSDK
jgi:HlyD family secretion protein